MYYDKLSDLGIKLTRSSGSQKVKCPQCSDGRKNKTDKPLSVNINTGEYCCHNCSWKGNVRTFLKKESKKIYEKPSKQILDSINLGERIVEYFRKRGISEDTLKKFMIFGKEEWMPQTEKKERCICFPYFRDGELVNVKYRDASKNFKLSKGAELIFYNLQSIGDKKKVIIVEGEIDCLSAFEAGFGGDNYVEEAVNGDIETGELKKTKKVYDKMSEYAVLSVPNGASKGSQKLEYLDNCSDWFLGVQEIVIATDNDEAGIMLKDELIRRFGLEICRVVVYPSQEVIDDKGKLRKCKDFNEVLCAFGKEEIKKIVFSAENIPIDGIYYVEDLYPSMLENFRRGIQLAPTTRFKIVDDYFRWKKGDINLFSGYANYGKTTFVIQMMLIKSIYDGWKWAIFSPENFPANDFYDDIVEMYAGKWLNKMTEKEYEEACMFINEHFFYVYPEDEHDINSIHEKFRYLVLKKGIDGVMIDPFNQLDKAPKPFERDDQYLSEQLKTIKRFALLNSVIYNVVAHPKNPSYVKGTKALEPVEMYDLAGGAMWGNKCDNITIYHRPRFHEDKNSPDVQIRQIKTKRKRTGGQNGEFELRMLWSQKRFCDPLTNEIPCDPLIAKKIKNDYIQKELHSEEYNPYLDPNSGQMPF